MQLWQHMRALIFIGVVLVIATPAGAQNRITVTSSVSSNRIIEGQSIDLEIRARGGDIEATRLGELNGFRVISGPSTSRNVQIINGIMSISSSRVWILVPTRVGILSTGTQIVTVNGKEYRTTPLTIEVLKASEAANQSGEGATVFLKLSVDKTRVYRGEQITATWKLYTLEEISGWEPMTEPDLKGFWTEDLFAPNKLQLREEVLNGRRYYSAEVRRIALFPTRSGTLEVDPLVLKIGVQKRSRRRRTSPFDSFSLLNPARVETRAVPSNAISINVRPIPTAGRPADFGGTVGRYALEGTLDLNEVTQDEAVTLRYYIAGEGNAKVLKMPEINFPQGLEVFDPKVLNEPSLGDIVGGSKSVEYVIVPRQSGRYTIPQVTLNYFNPGTGKFEKTSAGPFVLNVKSRHDQEQISEGFSRQEVTLFGKDIRHINMKKPRWLNPGKSLYTTGLIFMNLATVLLFAVPWLDLRFRHAIETITPGMTVKRALTKALVELGDAEGESVQIYERMTKSVTTYLNHKLLRENSEYSIDEIESILNSSQVESEMIAELRQIMDRAAAARFAPVSAGDTAGDRATLIALLNAIDKNWST